MASANYDVLNKNFAVIIDEPVTNATDDGTVFSSSTRSFYLNMAIAELLAELPEVELDGYKRNQTKTPSSGQVDISTMSPRPGKIFSVKASDNTWVAEMRSAKERQFYEKLDDLDLSWFSPDAAASPKQIIVFRQGGTLFLVPSSVTGNVIIVYTPDPFQFAAGGAVDLEIDEKYQKNILDKAKRIFDQFELSPKT